VLAGRPDEARAALQELLQHEPGHEPARQLLQQLEAGGGDGPR
jgi:hypothetical protein